MLCSLAHTCAWGDSPPPPSPPPRPAPARPAQTLKSTQAMADAMRGATKAMGAMNKRMNLPAMAKIMQASDWYCRGTARIVLPVYCKYTSTGLLCWCWFGAELTLALP